MRTYKDYVEEAVRLLENHNIDNARGDVLELLESVCGMDRTGYITDGDRDMPVRYAELLFRAASKRAHHIPLQHILGFAYFYGRKFKVNEDVLIPRFDTECVVEYALKHIKEGMDVLDMCTGSGCIGITVALEKKVKVCAADISEKALAVAGENATKSGAEVEFIQGDLFENIGADRTFDMIISNPPYIPSGAIAGLSPEVRDYDPLPALDGGNDGLLFYRRIINEGSRFLKTGGRFVFEIGSDQAEDVRKLLSDAGFKDIIIKKDLAGLDRIVSAVKC